MFSLSTFYNCIIKYVGEMHSVFPKSFVIVVKYWPWSLEIKNPNVGCSHCTFFLSKSKYSIRFFSFNLFFFFLSLNRRQKSEFKMNKSQILLVAVALLPLAWTQCLSRDDSTKLTADKLYFGQRNFSVSLLDALQKARPNESLFFSPHSTYRALLLAYFGANGETEESLKKTLRLDWAKSKADVSHAYELEKIARDGRSQHQTVEFNSVDKFYFSKQVELK